jgi:ADP-heptose:LPS heptosyltransferase
MKLHHAILRLAFRAMMRREPPSPPFAPDRVRGILLVAVTAIGDTLMSTPAVRAVRLAFPRSKVTALVGPASEAVLRGSPRIDAFIRHPGRVNAGFVLALPRLLKELRGPGFDLVIILRANDPDAGPLAYMTRAPWRMGWRESAFSFLFTFPARTRWSTVHVTDVLLNNLMPLSVRPDHRRLEMFLTDEDRAEADGVVPRRSGEVLVALHPFGSKANKRWPAPNAKAFSSIISGLGYSPVIIGGRAEAAAAAEIAAASGAAAAAGRLSIRGSAALIERSVVVVSTDSGPMHMAQALGVPTVALFGPDRLEVSGPVNEGDAAIQKGLDCVPCSERSCRRPEVECMKSITPEEVADAVIKRLEGSPARR